MPKKYQYRLLVEETALVTLRCSLRLDEETRAHLQSAHGRVLSIASVQQQLAVSRLGDVHLQSYFTQLCQSLGASMIHDPEKLSIEVTVDDSAAKANVSVSLGLIVTELVINALKHAFPGDRSGKIVVDYRSEDTRWSMSVSDDGVGVSSDPKFSKPGLRTGIVDAMAKQLDATFTTVAGNPGTKVSITHS
nr:sensor histidine kinase [Phyllobacterium sp. SYP-B3895]